MFKKIVVTKVRRLLVELAFVRSSAVGRGGGGNLRVEAWLANPPPPIATMHGSAIVCLNSPIIGAALRLHNFGDERGSHGAHQCTVV